MMQFVTSLTKYSNNIHEISITNSNSLFALYDEIQMIQFGSLNHKFFQYIIKYEQMSSFNNRS